MKLERLRELTRSFEAAARGILARAEDSSARVITIDSTYRRLGQLSLKQDELLRQSLRCVEHELYRAAHVMAWAAFVDFVHEKLGEDSFTKLRNARPNWHISCAEDLREHSDHQVIDSLREVGLCRKTEVKALQGLLNTRNECAHPEDYHPGLNEALGYVSQLLRRIASLQRRSL